MQDRRADQGVTKRVGVAQVACVGDGALAGCERIVMATDVPQGPGEIAQIGYQRISPKAKFACSAR